MPELTERGQLTIIIWLLIGILLTLLFGSEIKRVVLVEQSNGMEETGVTQTANQGTPASDKQKTIRVVASSSLTA